MKKIMTLILMLSSFSIFAATQNLSVDTSNSKVEWKATKVGGGHNGEIKLKSGTLTLRDGDLIGGEFIIDMTTITAEDIKDSGKNKKFIGHLNSDDFFSTSKFKTAKLVIKSARLGKGGHFDVNADLTIRGITKPILFKATIDQKDKKATAKADITFDRSLYDVKYGSGSFFKGLGDKLIHDDVELKVKLSTK
jgi:polyisoprenoid-binding protein YceI